MISRAEMVQSSLYRLHDLTPVQINFLIDDTHRFQMTCAGRRARKTLIGKRKLLKRSCRAKGNYFHAAPTQQQAKKIFWTDLKRYTRPIRTNYSDSELWVRLINGSTIHVLGLDKPERIEGQVWHGGHITEMGNVKPGAWRENIRPVFADTNGWCIIDGVPEGRAGDYYDMALYSCGGKIPGRNEQIKGAVGLNPDDPEWAYYHWYSSDVLPPHEIEAARRTYDERTFRQEFEGSFEGNEGLAYYAFSQDNLRSLAYEPGRMVYVGVDFNVNPMTATFSHIEGDTVYQFGEAYLRHSNTFEMRDEILSRFPVEMVEVYPDSTGSNRESNAAESDLSILRKGGLKVFARQSNPFVRDRLSAVNSKMRSIDGLVHYYVDPKKCPYTVRDFNKVECLADGRENKKQEDEGLVHISSALGYMIAYKFPVRERTAAA